MHRVRQFFNPSKTTISHKSPVSAQKHVHSSPPMRQSTAKISIRLAAPTTQLPPRSTLAHLPPLDKKRLNNLPPTLNNRTASKRPISSPIPQTTSILRRKYNSTATPTYNTIIDHVETSWTNPRMGVILLLLLFCSFMLTANEVVADEITDDPEFTKLFNDVLNTLAQGSEAYFNQAVAKIRFFLKKNPDRKTCYIAKLQNYSLIHLSTHSLQRRRLIEAFLLYAATFEEEALAKIELVVTPSKANSSTYVVISSLPQRDSAEALEQAVKQAKAVQQFDPELAEKAYHLKAMIMHDRKDYLGEIDCHDAILKFNPNSPEALLDKSLPLCELNRLPEALACCNKALAIDPDFTEAYFRKAHVLYRLKDPQSALAMMDKAIQCNKYYVNAYLDKAAILVQEYKKYEQAEDCLKEAIKMGGGAELAYFLLGVIRTGQGQPLKALDFYQKAIGQQKYFIDAYHYKIKILEKLGRLSDAKKEHENLIEIFIALEKKDPKYLSRQNYREAYYSFMQLQRFDEAIECCNKLIAIDPKDDGAYYYKAHSYRKKGDLNNALSTYEKTIAINPGHRFAYHYLTWILVQQGKTVDDHIDYFLKALSAHDHITALHQSQTYEHCYTAASFGRLSALAAEMADHNINVNRKNDAEETLLMAAARAGNVDNCMFLLRSGAAINIKNKTGDTAIEIARKHGFSNLAATLQNELTNYQNTTEYKCFSAAAKGQIEVLRTHLSQIDVNKPNGKGETLLMTAARHGQLEVVRLLVAEGGANVNVTNPYNGYRTASDLALEQGHVPVLAHFLQHRKQLTLQDIDHAITACLSNYRGTHESSAHDYAVLNYAVSALVNVDVSHLRHDEIARKITREQNLFKYLCAIENSRGIESVSRLQFTGWMPEYFLPLRIRYLFTMVVDIEKGLLRDKLPEEKNVMVQKLKRELVTEIETLKLRRDQIYVASIAKKLNNPANEATRAHAMGTVSKIKDLQENEEISYPTGFGPEKANGWWNSTRKMMGFGYAKDKLGHIIYLGILRKNDNIIILGEQVGYGADKFHPPVPKTSKNTEKGPVTAWKPAIIAVIPVNQLSTMENELVDYFQDVSLALFNPERLKGIYRPKFYKETDGVDNPWPAKSPQRVVNCVTKNADIGVQYRFSLTNKNLYRWFKNNEKNALVTRVPEIERDAEPTVYLMSELADIYKEEQEQQLPSAKL